MKTNTVRLIAAIGASAGLLCPGCAATGQGSSPAYLARQAEIVEEIRSIRQELRAISARQEEYDHRFSDESFRQPIEESLTRLSARLDALEKKTAAIEEYLTTSRAAYDKKMEAVISVVKSENAAIRKAIGSPSKGAKGEEGSTHTVQPGDTLGKIADRYGVSVKDLIEANKLGNANVIQTGRTLVIPR
jgi:LysM repeat protein